MRGNRSGNGARDKRVFGVLESKPVPTGLQFTVEDVVEHRFFDCANYDECLDLAVQKKWQNFTCKECPIWEFHKRNQPQTEPASPPPADKSPR